VNASHLVCARVRPRCWGDMHPSAPEMLGRYAPECARDFGEIFARVRPRFGEICGCS
jgi:hypothetical protein